tara:strand:+ start:10413 stop:11099 length:687 start_codon:yes stop_codon:yes gene_type:complete
VHFEHHDLLTDEPARQDLESRGIKAAPVTIIDGSEVIIGYYPKKLIPALNLTTALEHSGRTSWLAEKYDLILSAAMRASQQLTPDQLLRDVPWRPERVRDSIVHIISFPELAWKSHEHGSMSTDDMQAIRERLSDVITSDQICKYGETVRRDIVEFLNSGNEDAFDRVVPAHYGGEVTVLELLNIILSHSTHHLKQIYWFMETELGMTAESPATEQDMEGIFTPAQLI